MYSGRTFLEMKQWDRQIGKVYVEYHPTDKNQYRTIRVAWNPYLNNKYPQTSNYVTGTPPEGLEVASPLMLSQLRRVPPSAPF